LQTDALGADRKGGTMTKERIDTLISWETGNRFAVYLDGNRVTLAHGNQDPDDSRAVVFATLDEAGSRNIRPMLGKYEDGGA
jgi:hypothetical protein